MQGFMWKGRRFETLLPIETNFNKIYYIRKISRKDKPCGYHLRICFPTRENAAFCGFFRYEVFFEPTVQTHWPIFRLTAQLTRSGANNYMLLGVTLITNFIQGFLYPKPPTSAGKNYESPVGVFPHVSEREQNTTEEPGNTVRSPIHNNFSFAGKTQPTFLTFCSNRLIYLLMPWR
jgi:hypothetical protein